MFVILPTQLFDKKYLNKKDKYVIWEHPHYFDTYKYNKKKLMLHYGSMRYYYDYLKKNGYDVTYHKKEKKWTYKKYILFDPVDDIDLPYDHEVLDSPGFLLSMQYNDDYYDKRNNKTIFNHFYMMAKKHLNILPKVKSKDKDNRRKLPKEHKASNIPSNDKDKVYIKYASKMVSKKYSKNYGTTDDFIFPLSHSTAKRWLNDFMKKKFSKFGTYQDAISKNDPYIYHSLLSTSMNIGLLTPYDVIKAALKQKVKINNLEGFVRQIFWREYQRYCYRNIDFDRNYLGNRKKLSKKWYDGTVGIKPVDDAIKHAFKIGYLHHIQRLMVIGNYMNLSGIAPTDGYRWFMEFSCDSYDWVMEQNVLDMVFFVTGGETTTRPYVSSSSYILRMSDYKRDDWCDKWDKLYKDFQKKKKKKLYKFRYYFPDI